MKPPKIAIIGPTFSGNKGAAAMLISAVENLSGVSGARFYHFSYYPREDEAINPFGHVEVYSARPVDLAFKIFPLALMYFFLKTLGISTRKIEDTREIRALLNADILIDIAGVSFIDGREFFLPFNILTIWPAMLLGKPVVKYAQTLGPFNSPLNRLAAKLFLPRVKLIVARGKETGKYLQSLGLKNVSLGADGGFVLKVKKDDKQFIEKFKGRHQGFFDRKIIGIAPSSLVVKNSCKYGISYNDILAQFIRYLMAKNYNVLLVPTSVRQGSSVFNNDLPICLKIASLVGDESRCLVVSEELPPQRLKSLIGLSDLFFSSRFHAMVFALDAAVPTLVCGWSHKYREVLEMFGLEGWAFSYKTLSLKGLEKRFDSLEKERMKIKKRIEESLPKVRSLSSNQIYWIKNLLET